MITPSISVIIPVFNQEKWIGRCLRSLLNQTMNREEYELIVINDGSEDRTQFALDLFKDEIVQIKLSENIGLPIQTEKEAHGHPGWFLGNRPRNGYWFCEGLC